MAPALLNLICFRYRDGDEMNERTMQKVNAGGEIYLTHTRLNGRVVLRLLCGPDTELAHVERAWSLIAVTASRLQSAK